MRLKGIQNFAARMFFTKPRIEIHMYQLIHKRREQSNLNMT